VFDSDTFIATTGTHGLGVYAVASGAESLTLKVTNTITEGSQDDAYAFARDATSSVGVHTGFSDVTTSAVAPSGLGTAGVSFAASDTHSAPRFVDPGADNFAEKPRSPTVDIGSARGIARSATDLLGRPRVIGSGPDIGAYELTAKPRVFGATVVKRAAHALTVSVGTYDQGEATTYRIVGTAGSQTSRATRHDTRPSDTVVERRLTLHHLRAHTRYRIEVTATSVGGSSHTPPLHATTR
jgi:hypothetical protein